jgi:hypothetical protein
MASFKKFPADRVDWSPAAGTQLLTPFPLSRLDADERRAYLQRIFGTEIRLETFIATARSLGFGVTCHWDTAAGMPQLVWLH